MKLNRTGSNWTELERNKINENWRIIEQLGDTVTDLVLESGGDSNLEVVQARGGRPVLNDRLNDIETQLAQTEQQVTRNKNEIQNLNNRQLNDRTQINNNLNLINDLDKRIDTIITTPAEGVSAQEIIDARQGESSLGENLTKIKDQVENNLKNMVVNGDFSKGTEGWIDENTDSTISTANNTLTVKGLGTNFALRPYQVVPAGYIPGHKYFVKGVFTPKNENMIRIGFGLYKLGNGETIVYDRVSWPEKDKKYLINNIIELPTSTTQGDLGVQLRGEFEDAESSLNESFEVNDVIVINLTKVFGAGKEPSLEFMNSIIDSFPGFFSDTTTLSDVQKVILKNKANVVDVENLNNKVSNLITKVDEKFIDYIDQLPIDHNKYDYDVLNVFRFTDHSTSYDEWGTTTDYDLLFEGQPTIAFESEDEINVRAYYDLGVKNLSNREYIDVYLHVDNLDNLNLMQIDLMETEDLSVRYSFYNLQNRLRVANDSGWRYVRILKSHFDVGSGTPNWSNIRYMRVVVRSKPGTTVKVNMAKIDAIKMDKGAVSLYFDDGYEDIYTNAFPIMEKYGLRGTFNVVTSRIGNENYCTWSQLREMQAAGWLICSHSHTHPSLATLSEEEIRYELETSSRMLYERGFYFGSKCLVAPNGSWSPLVDSIAKEYYTLCRTISYGSNRTTPSMEFPQSHRRVQYYLSPYNTDEPSVLKGWVDNVINLKKEVSIAFHRVQENPEWQWSYNVDDFEEVIAYIREKHDEGKLNVVTWLDTMIQTPNPTPIDDEGNQYIVSRKGKPSILTLPFV